MTVTVKFFAFLEEKLGFDKDTVEVSPRETIQQIKEGLAQRYPVIAHDLPNCMIAVDMEFKADEDYFDTGKEIAVIPPVSGG
ncbi:molybdopterin converting factor subunit 1 [Bacillus thermotolerans]|uniref:Molybdopterin synthase sulfur carrier subunit n=1 Tax=Bacillus thermotolerans TaxID=1221996 RepID=A0A0F5I3A3_BACTR|nr:molybdopterin converting factor subunit 1 [Bacillus thermotolerans]KKB36904.1 Molybdenum cofactor biosynthesis protein MoaD [Bacillus thermotolerans]KKB39602.1 Molybdenum cofactor biosynthesis protein MoaD [Bacillus thermotolerans]KKB44454.1 Molybdenum cofactor biosynthesis protein MoaD [Bacillus thermotolerans]